MCLFYTNKVTDQSIRIFKNVTDIHFFVSHKSHTSVPLCVFLQMTHFHEISIELISLSFSRVCVSVYICVYTHINEVKLLPSHIEMFINKHTSQ